MCFGPYCSLSDGCRNNSHENAGSHARATDGDNERRLQRTVATYWRALGDAFGSDADTQSAVNDVVIPYTLTSYAKDALKNYVPQLLDEDTYDAEELKDDHSVRFTNRG